MNDETALIIFFFGVCIIILAKLLWRGEYNQDIFLGPGNYVVGRDIPPGKGDIYAEKGGGDFCIREHKSKDWNICNKIGVTSPFQVSRFRNICLNRGDVLEINGNVNLMITPPARIRDITKEDLGPGVYRFGVDAPPGRYDLKIVSGDGQILMSTVGETEYTFYQDMASGNDQKASEFANVDCLKDKEMWIQGSLKVKFSHSAKPSIWRF